MHSIAGRRLVSSLTASRQSLVWRCASPCSAAPRQLVQRLCSSSSGLQKITMPAIMDQTKGKVTKWHKKVGDELAVGDVLCEVSMEDFTIGLDVKQPGFLAKIVAEVEKELSVGSEIAIIADTEAALHELELTPSDADAATATMMLKAIRDLMSDGHLQNDEFATQLLSLARQNHPKLLAVFQSCVEGNTYSEQTFDREFFMTNVQGLIHDLNEKKAEEK